MKKTTVRFAVVGAVLLIGALALVLAQHDARERTREVSLPAKIVDNNPLPIPMEEEPSWRTHPRMSRAGTTVRANNDAPPELGASLGAADLNAADLSAPPSLDYQPQLAASPNPLRDAPSDAGNVVVDENAASGSLRDDQVQPLAGLQEESFVQQAGGQSGGLMPPPPQPLSATPLPQTSMAAPPRALPNAPPGKMPTSTMPAAPMNTGSINTGSINAGSLNAGPMPPATLPSGSMASGSMASGSMPPAPASMLPVVGLPTNANGASAPPSSNGLPSLGPPPPGWLNAGPAGSNAPSALPTNPTSRATSDLNDAQRRAMPPTNMLPARPGQLISQEIAPPTATLGNPQPVPSNPSASNSIQGSLPGSLPGAAGSMSSPLPGSNMNSRSSSGSDAGASRGLSGTAFGNLVSNQPGNRHLDGSQNPVMQIQKRMPEECTVGKRATVVITVRNAGNSTAKDVMVIDSVPSGASFAESMPAITPTPEGILVWKLGEMGPGDERTINLQIVPERQGELGSTAEVRFAAQASVRTLATSPKLELVPVAKPDVLIGSSHAIEVTVKNIGSGMARGVRLEADLPKGLRHESGDTSLEASMGDIAPGESKRIRLDAVATEPGDSRCAIRALTEDGLQQEQALDLRILAPQLQASIVGPTRRYLDRPATFEVMIKNAGTAAATRCEFILRLPAGLNFNTANKAGGYDPSQHAVRWYVDEFPAGHAEPVEFTVLPIEIGPQAMTFQGTADLGITTEARGALSVEEQGELTFTIDQDADPIEVSASTTYSVEVRNVGRVDRNVELVLQLPPGSQVLKVDAPVASRVDGDQLRFEPIPQMDSRSAHKFRIEVRHGKTGTQIVRAQLKSQNRPTVVIKEEATEVYNDQ